MGQLRGWFMASALEGGDCLQGHHWSEPAENSGFIPHPLMTVLIVQSSYTHEAAGNTSCSAPQALSTSKGTPDTAALTTCLQHLLGLLHTGCEVGLTPTPTLDLQT